MILSCNRTTIFLFLHIKIMASKFCFGYTSCNYNRLTNADNRRRTDRKASNKEFT